MNKSIVAEKRAELKKLMSALCKSADGDQKLCDQIKDRGFWERSFSNNIRDLAKSGIAQTELIEGIQKAIQDLMQIVLDADSREREMAQVVDQLRTSEDKAISKMSSAIAKTVMAVAKKSRAIKTLESKVDSAKGRIASSSAAKKCSDEVISTMKDARLDGDEVLDLIKGSVSKYFTKKGVVLRDKDKKQIVTQIEGAGLRPVEFDDGLGVKETSVGIICEKVLDSIVSEGDRYSGFRDELISIIDDFNDHREEVDPVGDKVDELLGVKRRLKESQFEIALIGQFQGGKSTTFNALCGGREISPRGINGGGVKTSAAVVTAQNIANGETKNGLSEWAEISWLSEEELKARIREDVIASPEKHDYSLAELRAAAASAWKNLDPANEDDDDRIDLLQVATLRLKVLQSGEYKKYVKKVVVPIDEFQTFVRFPTDWDSRWGEKVAAERTFSVEECLFSCVDSVLVRLRSKYLERLGCRITDCPGLFVNRWDTNRALAVMQRSNAIWFLCNGDKSLKKDEVEVLRTIRANGAEWVKKCFFTLNVRNPESSTQNIVQANRTKIHDAGFEGKNIFMYNALVSMRLQQMRSVRINALSVHDRRCLALESKARRETEKAAIARINKADEGELIATIRELLCNTLYQTKDQDLYGASMTDDEVLSAIEPVGRMLSVVTRLERYIISNKASSILIDKGANDCIRVLKFLQNYLKMIEDDAQKEYDQAAREWDDAKKRLKDFEDVALAKFGFLKEEGSLDDRFLSDFYKTHQAAIAAEAEKCLIDETAKEWDKFHVSSNGVEDKVKSYMSQKFPAIFTSYLNNYLNTVNGKNPTNRIYIDNIRNRVLGIWEDLSKKWSEVESECPKLSGVKPDESIVEQEVSPFKETFQQEFDLPVMCFEMIRNGWNWLCNKLFDSEREDTRARLTREIRDARVIQKAIESLKDSNSKSKTFKRLFESVRLAEFSNIEQSFAKSRSDLDSAAEKALGAVQKTAAKRKELADLAKGTRTTIIEPRMEVLDNYVNRVLQVYGE